MRLKVGVGRSPGYPRAVLRRPVVTGLLAGGLAALLGMAAAAPAHADDVRGGPKMATTKVVVDRGPGAAPLPKVVAGSWVLFDLDTGEVLAAKYPHRIGRPASTIKTLTALTLMRTLDPKLEHTVTWEEASADGGRVGVVPDATYTVWDLYHGLLLPSGNDAAAALAGANGGMKKTVRDMQAVADELGADDTVVKNSSGLDADGMVTSAFDLAVIARAAMQNDQFREVTATIAYDFPGRPAKKGKKRSTYKIYTQNRLLLHGYDGAIGGKTGWTTKAGRTFWGAAERKGRRLGVTMLRATQHTEDSAKALLSWGFANAAKVTPVGDLDLPEAPAPSAGPTEAAPEPGGDTALAGSTTAAAQGSSSPVVWVFGGVIALVLAGAWLWGRRSRSTDAPPPAPDAGSAPAPAARPDAPTAPAAPAAAPLTRNVTTIAAPGAASAAAPAPAPAPARTEEPVALHDLPTGEQPAVVAPPTPAPAAAASTPAPAAPAAPVPPGLAPAPQLPAEPAEPVPAPDPGAAPARPEPRPAPSSGHVKVIRPPRPEPRDDA